MSLWIRLCHHTYIHTGQRIPFPLTVARVCVSRAKWFHKKVCVTSGIVVAHQVGIGVSSAEAGIATACECKQQQHSPRQPIGA